MAEPIRIGSLTVTPGRFLLIAGPCVLESEASALALAKSLAQIAREEDVDFVFKASYDKANRTSDASFRGPGLEAGLKILGRIRQAVGMPILSDVHTPEEAGAAGKVLDCLQIPALLSRQTDLLLAAAETGRAVNIKKGQFMAPADAGWAIEKVAARNKNILITERGYTFGYNNLVADMRSLAILRKFGYPVIFDATHSVQLPGGGVQSGGERELVPVLARAAAGAGIDGMFLEVHPEPEKALSDNATMVRLNELPALLKTIKAIYTLVGETA